VSWHRRTAHLDFELTRKLLDEMRTPGTCHCFTQPEVEEGSRWRLRLQ
jgi:hypothetical protein